MQCRTACLVLVSCLARVWNAAASEIAVSVDVSVMDLGADNFTAELSQSKYKGNHFLIEFYAHWCPHCQHYKPTYEKIGRYFNGSPRPEPLIWVARMDCAVKKNYPVCDKFKVRGYPTLFLAKAEDFAEQKTDELTHIAATDAATVVTAINSALTSDYKFEEKTTLMTVTPLKRERREKGRRCDLDDIEHTTVELFERLFESHAILNSLKVRTAFVQWIALVAEAHPSLRCRKSSQFMQKHLDSIWPSSSEEPTPYIARFHICSVSFQEKPWGACKGSIPDKRGFTCGLWQLLHGLSVGINDHDVSVWIKGVRSFAEYFFGCEECAKHFLEALKKDEVDALDSKDALIMWLWKTHNRVNARISREEQEEGTADPAFPKVQWPPSNLCPECRTSKSEEDAIDWNEEQVLLFLKRFYAADNARAQPSISKRKELRNDAEIVSTDVFDKADATALELDSAKSFNLSTIVFVGLLVVVIMAFRRNRKRKVVARKKDLL